MTDPKYKYIIEVISKDLLKDAYIYCANQKEINYVYKKLKSYKINYKAETFTIH